MYVAMDWKPKNGCKIKNSCDKMASIMLQLKLVVTKEEEERRRACNNISLSAKEQQEKNVKVLIELIEPWANNNIVRIVCGDSFFASVYVCCLMKDRNLRFIGPVKTATVGFCKEYLSKLKLQRQGQFYGLYTVDNDCKLDKFAFTWIDRNCMQFISNTSSTYLGTSFILKR